MTPRLANAERERRRQLPMDWRGELARIEREQSEALPPRLARYDRGARWVRWVATAADLCIRAFVALCLGAAIGLWIIWMLKGAPG